MAFHRVRSASACQAHRGALLFVARACGVAAAAALSGLVAVGAPGAADAGQRTAGDAEAPAPAWASMQCDRANEPGRVRCTIEARTAPGYTLAWADVAIVSLPELATALKGRIGPSDATARDATSTQWAFGLVARKPGQGEARARVRVVACVNGSDTRCTTSALDIRANVVVGG